jgi:hypothetical protein
MPNFFFYESKRLAAFSRLRAPLKELAKHIDFKMFRPILIDALRKADGGKTLHTDSAYTGVEIEQVLKDLNIENKVCEKGYRGAPLTEDQRRHNRQKSKIRALVEHVFGFIENLINGIFLPCIGIKRATCQIRLANLT